MNTSRSKASVHARRVKACTICGRPQHGNGGAVSHGRGHVQPGRVQGHAQSGACGPGVFEFVIGFRAQPVVGVGGGGGQSEGAGQQVQDVQQGRGVEAR